MDKPAEPEAPLVAPDAGPGRFRVEKRHIYPIPDSERHGTTRGLFFIWLGINMVPITVVSGALGPTVFGLSFEWTLVAVVVGAVIGGLGSALHASQGPALGIPQMLQARAQFGYVGGSLLAFIALVMFLGFFASNLVVAAQSFAAVYESSALNANVYLVAAALIGLTIAVIGYDLVRNLIAVASVAVGIAVIVSIAVLLANPETFAAHAEFGFSTTGFFAMVAIAVTWQLAYAPYVSDYSRYMPQKSGPRQSFWATYIGLTIGAVLLMSLGALVGLSTAGDDVMASLGRLLGPLGPLVLVIFGVSAAVVNSANIYSGTMCSLTVAESFLAKFEATTAKRIGMTVVYIALAVLAAVFGRDNFLANFSEFVILLLYVITPWSAINLVDYFVIEKGHYRVDDLFRRDGGQYGRWNGMGLTCYIIGLLVQIPFMVTNTYTGFLGKALGNVDTAWLVGFVVPGALYLVWRRRAIAA